MPVPASTASTVIIPLYVKDELLLPIEDDYSVSTTTHNFMHAPARLTVPLFSFHPAAHPGLFHSVAIVCACCLCQPLLDGRISEAEWHEDCELLQAAYDRSVVLQRLRTHLRQHTVRQSSLLTRLYTALSLVVCCFCVLLDAKSEQLQLTVDVGRQRHAVLTAYVETMNRKYQYRQLTIAFEHDNYDVGKVSDGASGAHWFAVRLEQTSPSDRNGIGEEAKTAAQHARGRSHQRQKSASVMGYNKRLLSASSMVQVRPTLISHSTEGELSVRPLPTQLTLWMYVHLFPIRYIHTWRQRLYCHPTRRTFPCTRQ